FWQADSVGDYTLNSRLIFSDENSKNDSFSSAFTLIKTADIKADRIVLPTNNAELFTKQKYAPQVWIKNDGLTDFDLFSVVAEIYVEDTLFYTNTKAIELDESDSAKVEFDSLSFDNPSTNASMMVYVVAQGDNYGYNDTIANSFIITKSANVKDITERLLKVYPNPYKNRISVESAYPIEKIRLYSLQGKLVAEYYPNSTSFNITQGLNGNNFLLEMESNNSVVRRIVLFQGD
ncbi:MAG: T9SS type A sorting domain-containing protein, partial [Bacteroidia bacterium]|nr:T9SS type A sorting domain-containing protein [Bacteroidia bacterium]